MAKRNRNKRVVEYSDAFKLMTVRLTDIKGIQIKQVGECLDLHPFMVSRWRKQVRDGELSTSQQVDHLMAKDKAPLNESERKELEKLRKENEKLQQEVSFLKKWRQYLKVQKRNDSSL